MADHLPELGNPKAGDTITASWAQTVNRLLRGDYGNGGPPGSFQSRELGRLSGQLIGPEQLIPALLTGRSATTPGYFEFESVFWNGTDQEWETRTNGYTHLQLGEAHEISSREIIALHEIVYLRRSRFLVDPDGRFPLEFTAPTRWIWAELTGKTLVSGGANRWEYEWLEKVRGVSGWQAPPWTALTHALAAATSKTFNSIEHPNDATGVQGHGVDIDGADYPGGFNVIDASAGVPIVRLYEDFQRGSGTVRHISFAFENTDDGTCEAP